MSNTEKIVHEWREVLKESARTAVEALSAVTPIEENVEAPSTDEASKILGHAILKIRELMRPEPKTLAFYEEEAWYRMKGAPKVAQGEKPPFTRLSLVNIPEIGIEFHQFYTDDFYKAVCYWENKEGERRVYEITVKPWAATGTSKWRARAQVCGKVLFYLEGASKCLVIECALVAMRRYLIRSHRCAWRTYRKTHKKGGE